VPLDNWSKIIMKFTLKIQSIGGISNSELDTISNIATITHEFETINEAYLEKRGKLFLVLNLKTNSKFDTKSIIKLFVDTVQEEYFRINDSTPLHAIEKALNKAHKNILTVKSKDDTITLSSPESEFSCSFATALIWNSVLYTSYFGKAATYLIRGTGVRDLGIQTAYNEIWTSSSILADNDVIVIGTAKFAETFPPKTITAHLGNLSNVIEQMPEKEQIAAILIKVMKETPSQKETFSGKLKSLNLKNSVSQSANSIKNKIVKPQKLSDKLEPYKSQKVAPVSSISGLIPHNPPKPIGVTATKTKPKRLSKLNRTKRKWHFLIVGFIILAGIIYINYRYFYTNKNEEIASSDIKNNAVTDKLTNNIKELHPVFINLDHIAQGEHFVDLDSTSHNNKNLHLISPQGLYSLNLETKEAESIYNKLEDAMYISCIKINSKNLCYTFGNKTLLITNVDDTTRQDKYLIEKDDILALDSEGNQIYYLQPNDILKMRLGSDKVSSWLAENQELSNAVDFTTDGTSFFVISNRNILKYTNGKQAKNFEVDNSYLLKPIQIIEYKDKLYVLDALADNDKNIVIYNKTTGEFIKKIKLADKTDLEIPTKFTIIDGNPAKILFKKGNYLYEVEGEI